MIDITLGEILPSPTPNNEIERLSALYKFDILDAEREDEFDDITRLVARLCNVPIAMITMVDRDRQWFVSELGMATRESPRETSFCAHAVMSRDIMVVPDARCDPRFAENPLVTGEPHIRFYAGAPLETSNGLPIGTLCIVDHVERNLTTEQREILRVFSHQVMRQIELRQLLREQTRILAAQKHAGEMLAEANAHYKRIAETLQRSLLRDLRDMEFGNLEVAPLYESAWSDADIGGDFYDAFSVTDDKIALVLGDVAGKGLGAAARTAEVKYALRAFLQEYPHPARTLARLNDFLCGFHEFGEEDNPQFVVAALGIVDKASGDGVFSFAGAEPAIILRHCGEAETIVGHGLPLGIEEGAQYETFHCHLEIGDTLLLITDGLTEARSGNHYLGHEGVIDLAARCATTDLSAFAGEVLRQVKEFGGGSLRDDACLLMARRHD